MYSQQVSLTLEIQKDFLPFTQNLCSRCRVHMVHLTRAKKNIKLSPHVSNPARAGAFFGSLKKSIFFRGISLPSTDITDIRIKHALKRNFLNNPLQRKGRFPRSLFWCGRMKKENYLKQDFTVSNLEQNKNVSLPLSFF